MKIAVEGCCHGELDKIYETILHCEEQEKVKVELLLICGDFQAVRNENDLASMAVPRKYQKMNTFYKYYSGEKLAPILTIIIGGNHEASNYLQELPYGGWIAHNIYYLGYAGVVQFGGIRIAGISGIYKGHDFNKGHFEKPPYSADTKRSVYHIRNLETFRLKQISRHIDIFMSHDWPRGIYEFGDKDRLLKHKRFLRSEIETGVLGSPPAEDLLMTLKPSYWFSAHLHVKFAAVVQHKTSEENPNAHLTKFLALDKCLPRRQFLQVIDITPTEIKSENRLELDPEWLCILKSTNHLLSLKRTRTYMPGPGSQERFDFKVSDNEIKQIVEEDFGNNLIIPDNFELTASIHTDNLSPTRTNLDGELFMNSQTELLCQMLNIIHPNKVFLGINSDISFETSITNDFSNPDKISISDDDIDNDDGNDVTGESDDFSGIWTDSSFNDSSFVDSSNTPDVSFNDLTHDEKRDSSNERNSSKQLAPISPLQSSPLTSTRNIRSPVISRFLPPPSSPNKSQNNELYQATDTNPILTAKSELTDQVTSEIDTSSDSLSSSKATEHISNVSIDSLNLSPIKRFKRRNQSIYSSSDSTDELS